MSMPNTNVSPLRTQAQVTRSARGAFVEAALRDERWTIRQAAIRMGLSNTALGDRVKGKVAFLAEDIEDIAVLLKRDPVEFFAEYLDAKVGPEAPNRGAEDYRVDAPVVSLDTFRAARTA